MGERGDRICCYTTTLWSLIWPLYLLTMLSFTVSPTLTTVMLQYCTLYYSLLSWLSSQQGFVYPALSQMTGSIREHVLQLVSLGHQETDILKYLS